MYWKIGLIINIIFFIIFIFIPIPVKLIINYTTGDNKLLFKIKLMYLITFKLKKKKKENSVKLNPLNYSKIDIIHLIGSININKNLELLIVMKSIVTLANIIETIKEEKLTSNLFFKPYGDSNFVVEVCGSIKIYLIIKEYIWKKHLKSEKSLKQQS